jgi:acyl transferase domain-containing protein
MASMMDCQKVQPLLSEYVDGTLDGDAAWGVKMHVASCAVCGRIADDFTATARLLGTLERREPSVNFEALLAGRLADIALKPATPWQRLRAWWSDGAAAPARRPAVASAAALAALVPVAVVVFGQRAMAPGREAHPAVVSASPAAPADSAGALRDIWDDHTEFSSSQPLGDQSGVLASLGPDL